MATDSFVRDTGSHRYHAKHLKKSDR